MALFKIVRGKSEDLPETYHDGYAYFCTDTGAFYIDYKENESDTEIKRRKISAGSADKLINSADKGSGTKPVYFKNGIPVECTYELQKTVSSDALFTDEKVKQNADGSTSSEIPILMAGKASPSSGGTDFVKYDTEITINPAENSITATKFVGNLEGGADRLVGDAGKNGQTGSSTQPVYFENGVPKATTYQLNATVPSNAKFTDTNTKVTSVSNHYAPTADSASELSADAADGNSATWNSTNIVTGVNIQRDAKGHVVGVTVDSAKMPENPNADTNTAHEHVAGVGLVAVNGKTNIISGEVEYKAKLKNDTLLDVDSVAPTSVGGTYPVVADKSGNLAVSAPNATVSVKGVVQLSSSTSSTSETQAATSKAVKAAYDLADSAKTTAENVDSKLSGYKTTQSAVEDPTANGTSSTFIATISQDANGKISATKKTVVSGTTSAKGIVQLTSEIDTSENKAATPKAVKTAYDLANTTKTNLESLKVSETYETKTDASNKLAEAKKYAEDYADDAIALVMNNSSEAVDSVMELARAMANNETVVDALEEAIGGKAPTDHASTTDTYGVGSGTLYGHVKLSDATNSSNNDTTKGIAATPKAVNTAYSLADSAKTNAATAQSKANDAYDLANAAKTAAESVDSKLSGYKTKQDAVLDPNTSTTETATSFIATIAQNENGKISVSKKPIASATTSSTGIVQLSSSTSSSSESLAATPKAVKAAYDKAKEVETGLEGLTIVANASDDDVIILEGEGGVHSVSYSAAHADSGVTAGDYTKVKVNAKGHVIEGSNPTTLGGYGIGDAYTKNEIESKLSDINSDLSGSIKSLSIDGKVITYTRNDNTTGTITTQDTDTKVTNELKTTSKAYITGTTSATTNTGTQVFDTGVYLDTTAGQLVAKTFKGDLDGNAKSATTANSAGTAGSADKWTTGRKVTFTGDVSGNFTIDGSADVSNVSLSVSNDSHTHDGRYYTETEVNTKLQAINNTISGLDTSINDLSNEVNHFLNVDDETVDELSDVLQLIENNKGTLDSIVGHYIPKEDIADNLTTENATEVLSAKQGVVLKALVDNKQDKITGGATTITDSNLTASRALISNSSGKVAVSAVTSTELGYLDGVTSNIQTQLNGKAPKPHASTTDTYGRGTDINYGHVLLSSATNSESSTSDGVAATPLAVKTAYDLADSAYDLASTAKSAAEAIDLSNYKTKQESVSSPSPSTTTTTTSFIDTISQNANGVISVTKKPITTGTKDTKGIVQLTSTIDASEDKAATPKAVKAAYDLADNVKSNLEGLTIAANASDDDVIVLTGQGGVHSVSYSAAHADSGVTAGDYTKVKVNAKGHVIEGSNPTTLDGYGITDAYTKTEINTEFNDIEGQLSSINSELDGSIKELSVSGKVITYTRNDNTTGTITTQDTNTDTKVTQNAAITTAKNYPVILGYSDATTKVTNAVNKASTLTYNPSTQILTAPTFKGNLDGIAETAEYADEAGKATNDGSNRNIVSTYETKTDSSAKLTEAKGYIDTQIGLLINDSDPATLNSIYDLGKAIEDNQDAIEALNSIAAGKADATTVNNHINNKNNPHGVIYTQVGAAPTNHASTETTYGTGTNANYGHVKLSDSVNSSSSTAGGIAATPAAVKHAYDLAAFANSAAENVDSKLSGYKTTQSAVSSPTASGNTTSFIDTISQDANGVISATKKTVPNGSGSVAGIVKVHPAVNCTTYTSDDNDTCTPAAVKKAAKMFAITRPPKKDTAQTVTTNAISRWENADGDLKDSKIIIEDVTNTRDTSLKAQVIAIPAEGNKKMVYGYCTDQVDGTSFIGGVFDKDATAYPYSAGLAIGGTSGNLLWKGNVVATTNQIPTVPSSLKNPYSLTIQGNGTTLTNGTYDGSAAKTVNITPASIGAVSKAGDTMTGSLALKPATGEGGQIHLSAASNDTTNNGIIIDTANGDFRIFGEESGTKTGVGTVLTIDPYDGTINGGYTFNGNKVITSQGLAITQSDGTTGYGVSLYGSATPQTYGLWFGKTATFGTHGSVSSDWATYFGMNSGATTRGWVFRREDGCVASISGAGNLSLNGHATIGNKARLQYDSTNECLNFSFV